MTWEEVPKEDYVYCPECTSLAGIKVRGDTQPEIKQVRVTIGNKKYPIIDIDKVGSIKIKCQFCGYDLTQEILKTSK